MSGQPHTNLFNRVDRSSDPDFFVRFMDEADTPAGIQAGKRLVGERMALTAGQAVLDVGCGPGNDLFELVELVGPAGRVHGVDASHTMISEARRRAAQHGLAVSLDVAEVTALPYPDASFDVCRAARLLEHLPDAAAAVAEMARVTRGGGRVVVFDFDWDTLVIDHPDKATTRTVVLSYSDSIRNGWIGRQLPRLFADQRLQVRAVDAVQVFVHYALVELFLGSHLTALQTRGTLTPAQAQTWWEHLQRAAERQTLLVSFTGFIVTGTAP